MHRWIPGLLCALCLLGPAHADEGSDGRLDPAEIRTTREQVAGNQTLDEDLRAGVLELYNVAISALEAAALDGYGRSEVILIRDREAAPGMKTFAAIRWRR